MTMSMTDMISRHSSFIDSFGFAFWLFTLEFSPDFKSVFDFDFMKLKHLFNNQY